MKQVRNRQDFCIQKIMAFIINYLHLSRFYLDKHIFKLHVFIYLFTMKRLKSLNADKIWLAVDKPYSFSSNATNCMDDEYINLVIYIQSISAITKILPV